MIYQNNTVNHVQVDHRLYAVVLGSIPLEALKLALVSFEQDLLQKALDNWKQASDSLQWIPSLVDRPIPGILTSGVTYV